MGFIRWLSLLEWMSALKSFGFPPTHYVNAGKYIKPYRQHLPWIKPKNVAPILKPLCLANETQNHPKDRMFKFLKFNHWAPVIPGPFGRRNCVVRFILGNLFSSLTPSVHPILVLSLTHAPCQNNKTTGDETQASLCNMWWYGICVRQERLRLKFYTVNATTRWYVHPDKKWPI